MSNGRTSRLYRALVRDKQIASDRRGLPECRETKYPQLVAFYAFPIPGTQRRSLDCDPCGD